MNFMEIAQNRQSCRSYDSSRTVEEEKIQAVLQAGQLAPSACNGQPYHFTVCRGETAQKVARATKGTGMNSFVEQAPVMIVVSEENYVASAALGAKLKGNDYRSIDIGIAAAYLTAQATAEGLGTCILGWFDDAKIRELCHLNHPVRLVICMGYSSVEEKLRAKKRKKIEELVSEVE
ncbi:MAG: nitroreductase family protein [Clostridia bacterium]|nr:nitroreductase family protein [Clostridia bacterium]MDD6040770.1 nitroreductase family protein [Clostridia bacterium]